jgi:hypothetical protein
MDDDPRPDLHHVLAQRGQRPLRDLARQGEGTEEVGEVVGRRVELEAAYEAWGPLLPESKLPYSKDRIRCSLMNALAAIRDEDFVVAVKKGLFALDDFVSDADVPSDPERNANEWLKRRAARGRESSLHRPPTRWPYCAKNARFARARRIRRARPAIVLAS